MKTSTKLILGVLAAIAIFFAGSALTSKTATNEVSVGATSGPDNYNPYNFYNGLYGKFFTQGGGVKSFTATTTQAAYTVTQADLASYNVFKVVATTSPALTLTLPATSTLTTLIKNPGDMREWIFYNAHTGATTTTLVAGTGMTLQSASTTAVIAQGKNALVRLKRVSTGDVFAFVTLFN